VRRGKQVSFRRQRVVVEEPPDESAAADADDARDAEKIEVHVHLHRSATKARSTSAARPVLTGVLFDWQWYKDQLSKRPRPLPEGRWSSVKQCEACDAPIPSSANCCPRCGAPRTRRRLLPAAIALVALGSIVAAFALGLHVLGDSVPEHRAPAAFGAWSDDDYVIVEVPPAPPSPFSYTQPASTGASSSSGSPTR
jgi:hypothetical protein